MQKKQIPRPFTIDEQIANLQEMGLSFDSEEDAKKFLNDISYYRIIKAYSVGLKKDGRYKEGTSFEDIKKLYLFNANFRQILFAQIERIEVNFRCRLSNYFSLTYGPLAYLDASFFSNYPDGFRDTILKEIDRNGKSPYIKNFKENYENGAVPFYAAVEVFTFGTLSKFYKNMRVEDKKQLSDMYPEVKSYNFLQSWLESISAVRNICAHYGRIYNVFLLIKPRLYEGDKQKINPYNTQNANVRIMGVLMCMKHLLPYDEHWIKFVNTIDDLIKEYSVVDIRKLGFPTNWKELLLIEDGTMRCCAMPELDRELES